MPTLVRGLNADEIELGGGGTTTQVEEEGYQVAIETENTVLEPVYTKTYGGDSFGKHDTLTDGCGNTLTRQGGATGFQISIEGILTIDQLRTADEMGLGKGTVVELTLQPWSREYIVKEFSWDKPSDLNEWVSPNYPTGIEAFTFQLQTRDPTNESDNQGGGIFG